jgi:hypothetical protein
LVYENLRNRLGRITVTMPRLLKRRELSTLDKMNVGYVLEQIGSDGEFRIFGPLEPKDQARCVDAKA